MKKLNKLIWMRALVSGWTVLAVNVCFVLALSVSTITPQNVYAQSSGSQSSSGQNEQKTRRTPALSERVYNKLSKAQELSEAGDNPSAMQLLKTLQMDKTLNSYERAMTWNFTAYIYSTQDQYAKALAAFRNVIVEQDIPVALELQTHYSMAQLYMATEQFRQAIASLKKWFQLTDKPGSSAYSLLSQAYYQLGDYKSAVAAIEQAINLSRQQNIQPKEQWLMIKRAGYYELDNIPKVIEALEDLVTIYPKGEYFSQLSGMYGKQGDEKRQLLTLETAYDGGYLSRQSEYISLASLLLNNDVPYKAAKVLRDGIAKGIVEENVNNLRILAQAWMLAQEPSESIKILQKAAKKSDDGELYLRLGQSYADLDEWKNCVNAINAGLRKGGIKRTDSAYVTLGVCLYNDDKLDDAINIFTKARQDKRSRKFADQWIVFLRSERERRQRLADSVL